MADGRARLLAVDDTPENLDMLVGILQENYTIRVATSGERALRLVEKELPDMILLDIMMPDMDGFEVCRRLKAREEWAEVPVLFISALDRVEDKVMAFTCGGVDYITKPFQAEEVEARVATHLEIRRQKHELRENYERLSSLERLRDSLVHMVVHDLRSPLMGMSGCLQLLYEDIKDQLNTDQTGDLESAMAAAETLNEMVSSLLDVSRLEAGEMPLNKTSLDLRPVISGAMASLGSLSKGRNVEFTPAAEPVRVSCDAEITGRIVTNLIANALKFTPKNGEVRVTVTEAADSIKITVSDTGPGIPPEYRDRIFEKFGQVEAREEGRKFSTGLGLTFCKLATEAHGGEIGVDSEVGHGSDFWFTLPLTEGA